MSYSIWLLTAALTAGGPADCPQCQPCPQCTTCQPTQVIYQPQQQVHHGLEALRRAQLFAVHRARAAQQRGDSPIAEPRALAR